MDDLKDYFKAKGYNVVALPSATLAPLQLLAREGDHLTPLGNHVKDLFEPDVKAVPAVRRDDPVPEMEGQEAIALEGSIGIGVLKRLLSSLQLGRLATKVSLSNADKIIFSFEGVTEDAVRGMLDLDGFISGALPKVDQFETYEGKLKNSELFVITATLKCRNFHVKLVDQNAQNISVALDIQEAVSVEGQLKREQDHSFRISHRGKKGLVFAFKAVQILYDKPAWFAFRDRKKARFTIKAQTGWTLKDESEFPVLYLDMSNHMAVIE